MHFFHEYMANNIFIMIVSLTLKCGEVISFVTTCKTKYIDYVDSRGAYISGERNVHNELVSMPLV